MKIKRLEIVGFKSFVEKVSLDFRQGITGVVGPNGCGKSNIVDAIRWAMGEQNVRHLRGRMMEDIIFGGSESRKPHGMAQVSIVFDNSAGLCPPAYREFAEIMVTRRLFRNGDSEYLINKTACRLLDITELFMDTGVGARAYSIIEQGKVGMLVSAKPEERRVLIEEVAGVTKFKARKKTALRKMDATRQNLVRLGDIITEVRRQIGSLKRQAQRAEKFRDLRGELKRVELSLTGNRFQQLSRELAVVAEQEEQQSTVLSRLDARLEDGELRIEEQQLQLAAAEAEHSQAQEKVFHLSSEIQRVESDLQLIDKQKENLLLQDQEAQTELDSASRRLHELKNEAEKLLEQDRLSAERLQLLQANVRDKEGALQEQVSREQQLNEEFENCRQALMELFAQASRMANRREEIDRRLAAETERRSQVQNDSERLREEQAELHERREQLADQLQQVRDRQQQLRDRADELQDRQTETKNLLAGKEAALAALRQDFERTRSRQESLTELQHNLEGYNDGTRFLLNEKIGQQRIFADLLRVPAEYEIVVELALGERLQAVPLDAAEDIPAILEKLIKQQARAKLLFPARQVQATDFSAGTPLVSLVKPLAGMGSLVGQLLAGVFLVDDVVRHTGQVLPPGTLLVDQRGGCLDWQGVFSAGSATAGGAGLLRRQRQLDEIGVELTRMEGLCRNGEADVAQLRDQLLDVEEAQAVAASEAHRLELQALDLGKDRQSVQAAEEHLNKRLALIVFDLEQIDEGQEALNREKLQLEDGHQQTGEQQQELEQQSAELQRALATLRVDIEAVREGLTAERVSLAALEQQQQALNETVQRIDQQREEIEQRMLRLEQRKKAGLESRQKLLQNDHSLRIELDLLIKKRQEQQQENEQVRERYEKQREQLEEFREQQRKVRSEAEDLRKTVAKLQLRSHELQVDAEHVRQTVLERYRVDLLEHQVPEATESELERQQQMMKQLQQRIEALGEVNLMAIDEYREQEERYEFLSRQRDDLNRSLEDLQKAISQINRTTRRRFKETFELVNEKFKQVFPRLFRGGQAELRLTDENDLLETGIEIIVQPPGKRLQNVNLLSGGEKALTAVALIFSLFLIKPTPFCILDEVDAPLDDANIDRFAEMVREMTEQSQFIIITHSKRTMSIVDTMYGVTMQEPGVSRLVSVRMNDLSSTEGQAAAAV